ncbi:hypothetical protein [Paraburkholderia sejongensis]|nr:hypothetical protein [Paraburkholderia sp. MMS20-SJTR3]
MDLFDLSDIDKAWLLPSRKTVQNDDFGAPFGAPSGCGEKTA